jgi:hypothetical protein
LIAENSKKFSVAYEKSKTNGKQNSDSGPGDRQEIMMTTMTTAALTAAKDVTARNARGLKSLTFLIDAVKAASRNAKQLVSLQTEPPLGVFKAIAYGELRIAFSFSTVHRL